MPQQLGRPGRERDVLALLHISVKIVGEGGSELLVNDIAASGEWSKSVRVRSAGSYLVEVNAECSAEWLEGELRDDPRIPAWYRFSYDHIRDKNIDARRQGSSPQPNVNRP